MTNEQLRVKLATDANFIFSYIYGNNPDAVIENMRGIGVIVNNADDIFRAINELYADGRLYDLQQVFAVPIITNGMDPGELAAVQDVISAQAQAVNGGPIKKLSFDNLTWESIGGLATGLIGALTGQPVAPTSTTAPPLPAAATKTDNTITIVAIAGGVILVVVVLILAFRKR